LIFWVISYIGIEWRVSISVNTSIVMGSSLEGVFRPIYITDHIRSLKMEVDTVSKTQDLYSIFTRFFVWVEFITKALLWNPASELPVSMRRSNIDLCHLSPVSFLEEKRSPCTVCVCRCVSLSTLEATEQFSLNFAWTLQRWRRSQFIRFNFIQ
jgi:hypothetical protein